MSPQNKSKKHNQAVSDEQESECEDFDYDGGDCGDEGNDCDEHKNDGDDDNARAIATALISITTATNMAMTAAASVTKILTMAAFMALMGSGDEVDNGDNPRQTWQ